jgi:hypothetical protein
MEPSSSSTPAPRRPRAFPIATCVGASLVGLVCWIASSPAEVSAADRVRAKDASWSVFRAPGRIELGTPLPGDRSDVWGVDLSDANGWANPGAVATDAPAEGASPGSSDRPFVAPEEIGVAGQ